MSADIIPLRPKKARRIRLRRIVEIGNIAENHKAAAPVGYFNCSAPTGRDLWR
jgi:hypothetical protein